MSLLTLIRSTIRGGVIWEFGKSNSSGLYTISARNDYNYSVQKLHRDEILSDDGDSKLEHYFANDFRIASNYVSPTISDFPKTVAVILRALDHGVVIGCKSNLISSDAVDIHILEGDVEAKETFDFVMYPKSNTDDIFASRLIMLIQRCSEFGYAEACRRALKEG